VQIARIRHNNQPAGAAVAIVPISLDPDAEARALLRFMLAHGDIVGTDHAGRTILQLAVDPWTLDQLCAFDAGSEDLEDADAEPEPEHEMDSTPIMLDEVRAKRPGLAIRCLRTLVLALLLVVPHLPTHADQAPAMTRTLPMSTATAQASKECCKICRKSQPCGDSCISAERQCKKETGCACSAASGS
jgi:hypothetical protein